MLVWTSCMCFWDINWKSFHCWQTVGYLSISDTILCGQLDFKRKPWDSQIDEIYEYGIIHDAIVFATRHVMPTLHWTKNPLLLPHADSSILFDEPTLEEVTKLRSGRAPGFDGISAELLNLSVQLPKLPLFIRVLRTGHIPSEWKDGILVTLYKGKGPKSECSSYRPITLLSIPGKALLMSFW